MTTTEYNTKGPVFFNNNSWLSINLLSPWFLNYPLLCSPGILPNILEETNGKNLLEVFKNCLEKFLPLKNIVKIIFASVIIYLSR